MQAINTLLADTQRLECLQVPQYPISIHNMTHLIKTHTINSVAVLSSIAHECGGKVNNQCELFIDMVDKYFTMDSQESKDNKVKELMYQYFASFYDDNDSNKVLRDLVPLADGYMTVLSSFTHYHAQRLGERHKQLQRLLLANRIDPVCQPLFLSLETGKLYMLDDNYMGTFGYNKAQVGIIDITTAVFNLLKECDYIADYLQTLKEWCMRLETTGRHKANEYLGELLALAVFQYTEDNCFVVRYV